MVGMARVWYMHGTYELVWVDWDLPGTMAFRCSCQGSADLWMSNLGVSAMGLCSEWLTVARLLCDLFRLETPNTVGHSVSLQVGEVFGCNSLIHEVRPYVGSYLHRIPSHKLTSRAEDFTTIRIQKFASAVTWPAIFKMKSSTSSELYLLQWFLLYKAQVTRCSIHKLNKSLEEKSAVQPWSGKLWRRSPHPSCQFAHSLLSRWGAQGPYIVTVHLGQCMGWFASKSKSWTSPTKCLH